MYKISVANNIQSSKVEQIVVAITKDIDRGALKGGQKLPSINEFSDSNKVARDTVEKAYKQLRTRGYIASYPSRGYFVLGQHGRKQLRVLLIFNKLSSFKKSIYDGILQGLGKKAKVDLQIHHYDPKLLREILDANLGKYDVYAVMPHFFTHADIDECQEVIRKIPSHQLLVLDKNINGLHYPYKSVFQDFRMDILEALYSLQLSLKKYQGITLILSDCIHHPKEIIEGVKAFCNKAGMKFCLKPNAAEASIEKGTVYITTEDDDLAELIKQIRKSRIRVGKEVGIISFNETVFKELLDITVISTDFPAMGQTAAELILNKEYVHVKNPFLVIKRGSL
jgi:DNA-binding transcriptional regulator YhcF (GntR family)